MYDVLQLVRGCVAKRELVPLMSHFCIADGRIQGGNGHVAIDSPCPELAGLRVTVQADKFLRAAEACKWEPKLSVENTTLTVKRSKFRAALPVCNPDQYPSMEPGTGQRVQCPADLLEVLRKVEPFIGEDAQRPWSITVKYEHELNGMGRVYACNNVSAVCMPLQGGPSDWQLPVWGVNELLRVGEVPAWFSSAPNNMTFFYHGDAWLRVSTTHCAWPDVDALIHGNHLDALLAPVTEGLANALEHLQHFADKSDTYRVEVLDNEATCGGASFSDVGMPDSAWALPVLRSVAATATAVDWTRYPRPVPFEGAGGLRGVAIGLRA